MVELDCEFGQHWQINFSDSSQPHQLIVA